MDLYAIKIRKSDLALITLLNQGVTPDIDKKTTYFIFDATWNSEVPTEIVTERELFNRFNFKAYSPLVLRVKPV